MLLSAGTRLGPYELLELIGAGGMGEVYKGRDTRLDRIVAIKVSKIEFSERFEREAKAIAALNHPHICQIYDVGPNYLVMEYIEGDPIKGPLPLKNALEYAEQIVSALDAAHTKKITHRDLKPGNILATKSAGVKLLDFGLARIEKPLAVDQETVRMGLTMTGEILGTVMYMSPEQAQGKEADARSDIFSFGLVFYEMITGKRAFEGSNPTSIIAAILEREAPALEPEGLNRVVRACLAKNPADRFQTARDLKRAIEWSVSGNGEKPAPEPGAARRLWLAWSAAALLAIIAVVSLWGPWRAQKPLDLPLVRLDVDLGPEVSLGSMSGADVILSPDGARLVFVSKDRLFTRRLNQPKASELAGTEGAYGPFFSPDGQRVAFFSSGKLKKIPVEGGAVIVLCDAPSGRGGVWGEDHTIIASLTPATSGLSRIPDDGGAPQPVTELAQGELTHRWPQLLSGGQAVLFTNSTLPGPFDAATIEVVSLDDRRRKTLIRGGTYGRYLATSAGAGHLVFVNKGTLFAVPMDLDTMAVRGTPVPVVQDVSYSPNSGSAQFDFSQDGTLVYRSRGMVTLQWLDGGGQLQSLPAKPGGYGQPQLSPDGKLVALTVLNVSGSDIWTYDWQRDAMSRLTFGEETFMFPVWSPDGRYIAFRGDSGIFWTRADGAGKPQPLTQSKESQWSWSFSPDGKRLAFTDFGSGKGDLWTVPVENDAGGLRAGKAEVFLQTPAATEISPAFSPDGRWIAYTSFEAGPSETYVRAFPDNGRKWQISNSGGAFAIWSPNGREMFYRTPDQKIMMVSYTTKGDHFVPDRPRLWSSTKLADTGFHRNLDIAPDGKRFIALIPAEEQGANHHVIFLQNFFDEVRRRTAGAK